MANLSDADRITVWRALMERAECPGTVLKTEFRAAVNDLDAYLESTAAALNSALPQPYRGAATQAQKAALLAAVALKKWGRDL
jgi:hypothetical protein